MSASKNSNDQTGNDPNIGINIDELEELMSAHNEIDTESRMTIDSSKSSDEKAVSEESRSLLSIKQLQNTSLSLEKSLSNIEENSGKKYDSDRSNTSLLSVKTSNVPGPVGLLPILKTNDELRRLKEDKTARETLLTSQENISIKRPKTSSDLFSLNINNYPSYTMALKQLHASCNYEPISIHTALIKARLGIKKRIPLMCAAVTHYDRQETTILLDKSAYIRATFIGDDESLDNLNVHVGHTLVLRNVAVFTSTRHRHHYVNIHLQNILAIQDPLGTSFTMPLMSGEVDEMQKIPAPIVKLIENDISIYEDSSNANNETFQLFSQSDDDDEQQPPAKRLNTSRKSSNNSAFNRIKTNIQSTSANKFQETIADKPKVIAKPPAQQQNPSISTTNKIAPTKVTNIPTSSTAQVDLIQIVEKPIAADVNVDDFVDEFFSVW